jgi:hypothetical protein
MGYKAEPTSPDSIYWHLLDPKGHSITFPPFGYNEEEAWDDCPPLDTWEGAGLVLKWLGEHNYYFEIFYEGCYRDEPYVIRDSTDEGLCGKGIERTSKTVDDFPKAICEFLLEVTK